MAEARIALGRFAQPQGARRMVAAVRKRPGFGMGLQARQAARWQLALPMEGLFEPAAGSAVQPGPAPSWQPAQRQGR